MSIVDDDRETLLADARELLERSKAELYKFDETQCEAFDRLRSFAREARRQDVERLEGEMRECWGNWRAARRPMLQLIAQLGRSIAELTPTSLPIFIPLTPHQRPRA